MVADQIANLVWEIADLMRSSDRPPQCERASPLGDRDAFLRRDNASVHREYDVIDRDSSDNTAGLDPDDLTKHRLVESDAAVNLMSGRRCSRGVSKLPLTRSDHVFRLIYAQMGRLQLPLITQERTISTAIRINRWRIKLERLVEVSIFPPLDQRPFIVMHFSRKTAKIDPASSTIEKGRHITVIAALVTGQFDFGPYPTDEGVIDGTR